MSSKKPNIVVITTHDSGCHFGCYGVPTVHTPNIDALAAGGMRFTRMHATAPICSPSRASLLTGQYPARHGLLGLTGRSSDGSKNWGGRMTAPTDHLAHVIKQSGYTSLLFGHQHEIADPDTLGHDVVFRGDDSAKNVARTFARWAGGERAGSQPFFAQIGFHETHTPYDHGGNRPDDSKGVWVPPYCQDRGVREAFKGLSSKLADATNDEALRSHLAGLQGSLRATDEAVGIILDALKANRLEENTIVLFNTDHGPELPHAKWTVYDAGSRIAFIMRWPGGGLTGGKTCDHLLTNADFVPTLRDLAGLDISHTLDGASFVNALRNPTAGEELHDAVYCYMHYGNVFALRTKRFSLIRCLKFGVLKTTDGYRSRYPFEMFDLEQDPLELKNIADNPTHAADYRRLATRFWLWLESMNDPILGVELPEADAKHGMM